MFSVERSAIVNYSAEKMYELVNDIGSYPCFLPGCKAARVLHQKENIQEAFIQFTTTEWVTKNILIPGKRIEMQLLTGPFRHLHGVWQFTSLYQKGCHIALTLDIEPKNYFLKLVAELAFKKLADQLVRAFCKRAETIYGQQQLEIVHKGL